MSRARRLPLALIAMLAVAVLVVVRTGADTETPDPAGNLVVRSLAPGVWMHTSFADTEHGGVSANGILVTTGEIGLLIDTGWNERHATQLLEWARRTLGQPIDHVIVTNELEDRTGGLPGLTGQPVIVHGHAATAQLSERFGESPMHWTFDFEERLDVGGERIDLFYPGPGRSQGNIVVWLPRRKVLYAGSLVLPLSATDLGETEGADLEAWPTAVRRVIERFRDAEIVVPGHGRPGGVELLSHTMELLEKAARQDATASKSQGRETSIR